jgi:hypothetical protein
MAVVAMVAGERWRVWAARISVVLAAVLVALSLNWLWEYANADDPAVIDDPVVVRAVDGACAVMRQATATAAVGIADPVSARVAAINTENVAVEQMIATIRDRVPEATLVRDQPSLRWLQEWRLLVASRQQYARALATGSPKPMVVPTVEGKSLIDRLGSVGVDCGVPRVLIAP